ncbi:Transcriptional regulator, TetR family [[Actinomadura] parvosata subsp. kistnae]|uniref:TetR family transcriptional regulator n=1 Tax=[Actinomadura] parvosata subsp. kistnae TaxID=1909395 RepID=A0A1V0AEK2_9ACTN|nr:TetR/AcrR family transcriptional regulator [Nonomuraea sp. ATCC 55076]AQZ68623.1 TetR family transcriptional regulator [Nonomuraea sp. ATCC 55076]SPL92899.1 Transcriptional regulator, TetR family [Actinomadura parvosata subsp. kistnae]
MSAKDKLLTAARDCLLTKGYAHTTVRDLVAASGANQASINYHFGSKEQLLTKALRDLNTEWGELLFAVLGEGGEPEDQEALWGRIIESIRTNRELWFVNFESVASARQDGEIRAMIAAGQELARASLARAFAGLGPGSDPDEVHAAGSHYLALLVGLASQWLTDPERAPTAEQFVAAHGRR